MRAKHTHLSEVFYTTSNSDTMGDQSEETAAVSAGEETQQQEEAMGPRADAAQDLENEEIEDELRERGFDEKLTHHPVFYLANVPDDVYFPLCLSTILCIVIDIL